MLPTTFPDGAINLEPCSTEDSTDCFWDASISGNSTGQSFLNYDGHTILFDVTPGYHVHEVLVDPAGINWEAEDNPGYGIISYENEPSATPQPTTTSTATEAAPPAPAGQAQTDADLTIPTLLVVAAFVVSLIILAAVPLFRKKAS